ncbi:hypothetical protein N1F89_17950 [Aquibium sp. A9E412]|uniref:hypothetical protein n=1 Tax=Aquibium sp. A9E412 TaxID=2976767 RepID=UPI0025B0DE8D|nr:hypothetical protein [Aquibium sp. A9E412]MDN2568112.1 hypothetical protein [Aquibium sp. A9E412]
MSAWIGPAIVAAVISSLISALGWFVNYHINIRLEGRRRREKIRDFQIGLRAEIRSEIHDLESHDHDRIYAQVEQRYRDVAGYSVTVPHMVRHVIFETVAGELQILPAAVIDPLIVYTRQRDTVERFVEDLRSEAFRAKQPEMQLQMYRDYLNLRQHLLVLAREAKRALDAALAEDGAEVSSPVGDRSGR